jgi:proteasome-associated ATPase
MPFLFIDEAESILGTRRASRYSNILSTLVPMFCSEMDGIDSLNDVVIILASNRADLIDPAILRPGRIDRKIKVDRPDKAGAREIYRIYLTNELPYDGALAKEANHIGDAIDKLIERFVDWQFAQRDENKVLEVTLRSGRKEILYRSDLISGAIIASVVERAKGLAIKRAIASQKTGHPERSESGAEGSRHETLRATQQDIPAPAGEGITEQDLQMSFHAEYAENDIFPPTDITEDWLKLIDYDPEYVVKIAPFHPNSPRPSNLGGVI